MPGYGSGVEQHVEILLRVKVRVSEVKTFLAQADGVARPSEMDGPLRFTALLRPDGVQPWGTTVDLATAQASLAAGQLDVWSEANKNPVAVPGLVLSIDGSALASAVAGPGAVVLCAGHAHEALAQEALAHEALAQTNADFLSRAAARGEQFLAEWTEDGTLVCSNAVEEAWKVTRQAVDAARERGEIFSVWVRSRHWYPAELLKFTRPDLKRIVQGLGEATPTSKTLFLLKQHGALAGRTPAQAVQAGAIEDVVRIAREWARA